MAIWLFYRMTKIRILTIFSHFQEEELASAKQEAKVRGDQVQEHQLRGQELQGQLEEANNRKEKLYEELKQQKEQEVEVVQLRRRVGEQKGNLRLAGEKIETLEDLLEKLRSSLTSREQEMEQEQGRTKVVEAAMIEAQQERQDLVKEKSTLVAELARCTEGERKGLEEGEQEDKVVQLRIDSPMKLATRKPATAAKSKPATPAKSKLICSL